MYSYEKRFSTNLPFHLHQYYEILLFLNGNATYVIDGIEYAAQAGDIFITKPNELHSIFFVEDCIYERHFVQFDEDFLNKFSDTLADKFNLSASLHKISAKKVKQLKLDDIFNKIYDFTCSFIKFEHVK